MTAPLTEEVRREDGEAVGRLTPVGDQWQPETLFGGVLGGPAPYDDARELVLRTGMAALLESWWLEVDGEWVRQELDEIRADAVRVRDWSPFALAIGAGNDAGRWIDPAVEQLRLQPPR